MQELIITYVGGCFKRGDSDIVLHFGIGILALQDLQDFISGFCRALMIYNVSMKFLHPL
jgi:hypothetical protein